MINSKTFLGLGAQFEILLVVIWVVATAVVPKMTTNAGAANKMIFLFQDGGGKTNSNVKLVKLRDFDGWSVHIYPTRSFSFVCICLRFMLKCVFVKELDFDTSFVVDSMRFLRFKKLPLEI